MTKELIKPDKKQADVGQSVLAGAARKALGRETKEKPEAKQRQALRKNPKSRPRKSPIP